MNALELADDMDLEVDQRIARYWERQMTPEKAILDAMEGKTIRSVANFRDGFYAGVAYVREMKNG